MGKEINLLIIDDEHDEDAVLNMSKQLNEDGFQINHFCINPKSKKYERNDAGDMDTDAVFEDIKKYLKKHVVHIIACDHTLGADINGVMVLSKIRQEYNFKGINILFSTKIETILHEILDSDKKGKQIDELRKLVRTNIIDFPQRQELHNTLKGIIKKTKFEEVNLRHELLKWLHAFKDHHFNGHPNFERKSLGKMAQEIEDETVLGIHFQKVFVEQAISKMIKLNNLPPYE